MADKPRDKRDKKTLHQLRADAIVQFHDDESPEDLPANVRLKRLLDKMRELNRRVDDLSDLERPAGGKSRL